MEIQNIWSTIFDERLEYLPSGGVIHCPIARIECVSSRHLAQNFRANLSHDVIFLLNVAESRPRIQRSRRKTTRDLL
eukprot:CAMPEP_0119200356 /NCGR_PEP_ID=MMETSP1316-20130426/25679_1 /TAXON_ID=41880 /ORGANISM="Pycnococcus provasolii, Strain RCC2336" /LENGTH=76 /DNA_ID=CAMNT_0007196401 /DNA_START=10 /DNA_END=240 /DNA_ORIENTATION=-